MTLASNQGVLWRAMERAGLPQSWRRSIWDDGEKHRDSPTRYAMPWLGHTLKTLNDLGAGYMPIDSTNDDLKKAAGELAERCRTLWLEEGGDGAARVLLQSRGIEWPGAARSWCPRWWKRQLSVALDASTEVAARSLGHVGGGSVGYVSEQTQVRKLGQRQASKRAVDAATCVEQQEGEECALREAVDASVANPKIRRAELMTRLRGLDALALEHGHVGLFITATLASRYHPAHHYGKRNRLWNGETVQEGHANLMWKWKRARSRWTKHGLMFYGMRVGEPHHCGTEHQHFMVFVRPDDVMRVVGHFLRVFREDHRDEPSRSALVHRVQVERIRPDKGGAAAYLAKYVAKNIDGENLEAVDKSNATRVRSWASAHRIRQFDFFGGPPVGTWREIRRIEPEDDALLDENLRAAFQAANKTEEHKADWAGYVRANGGIFCKRRERPIQLQFEFDVTAHGAKYSAYGDFKWMRVCGVESGRRLALTRLKRWTVRWGSGSMARSTLPWTRVNNCNQSSPDAVELEKTEALPVGTSVQSVDSFSLSLDFGLTGVISGESFTSGLKRDARDTLDGFFQNDSKKPIEIDLKRRFLIEKTVENRDDSG